MNLEIDLLREIVVTLPDPVFILTESGRYAALLGGSDPRYYHDGSFLVGKSLHDVLPREKADWFLEQIQIALQSRRLYTVEYGLAGDDVEGLDSAGPNGEIWFEGRIQPLSSAFDGERAVVWVARNITERYRLEAQLRQMSETDALTGLFNRRRLLEELEVRLREFHRFGTPMAVLMLDIDHFKAVNDCYGHVMGDQILRQVARVCREQLREVDLLARFGGEEFMAILPQTDLEQALLIAERLCQQVTRAVDDTFATPLTISIGLSRLTPADTHIETVIKRADDALYRAKETGRNRVVATP